MHLHKQLVAINAKIELISLKEQSEVLRRQIAYQEHLVRENCQHVHTSTILSYNKVAFKYDYKYLDSLIDTCNLCSRVHSFYTAKYKGSYA